MTDIGTKLEGPFGHAYKAPADRYITSAYSKGLSVWAVHLPLCRNRVGGYQYHLETARLMVQIPDQPWTHSLMVVDIHPGEGGRVFQADDYPTWKIVNQLLIVTPWTGTDDEAIQLGDLTARAMVHGQLWPTPAFVPPGAWEWGPALASTLDHIRGHHDHPRNPLDTPN